MKTLEINVVKLHKRRLERHGVLEGMLGLLWNQSIEEPSGGGAGGQQFQAIDLNTYTIYYRHKNM